MKTLIIDTSYLIYRSYFAYPNFSSNGKHTGAIYGVIRTVLSLCKNYQIDRLIFALDLPKPTRRHELYKEYKSGRPPMDEAMRDQIPAILQWARQVTPYVLAEEGYEADDMICSVIERHEGENYIMSSDRDLYQLLFHPNICFLKGNKSGYSEYKIQEFVEEFGIQPDQYTDYKALVGDASDNIKGAMGIGPKSAAKLLQQVGSLKGLYDALSWETPSFFKIHSEKPSIIPFLENKKNLKIVEQIFSSKESVELAYQLSLLQCRNVQLGEEKYDFTQSMDIYAEYRFKSIMKELGGVPAVLESKNNTSEALL